MRQERERLRMKENLWENQSTNPSVIPHATTNISSDAERRVLSIETWCLVILHQQISSWNYLLQSSQSMRMRSYKVFLSLAKAIWLSEWRTESLHKEVCVKKDLFFLCFLWNPTFAWAVLDHATCDVTWRIFEAFRDDVLNGTGTWKLKFWLIPQSCYYPILHFVHWKWRAVSAINICLASRGMTREPENFALDCKRMIHPLQNYIRAILTISTMPRNLVRPW